MFVGAGLVSIGALGAIGAILAGCLTIYKPLSGESTHATPVDATSGLTDGASDSSGDRSTPWPSDGRAAPTTATSSAPSTPPPLWTLQSSWPARERVWTGFQNKTIRTASSRGSPRPRGIAFVVDGPLGASTVNDAARARAERELADDIGLLLQYRRARPDDAERLSVTSEGPGSQIFVNGTSEDLARVRQSTLGAASLYIKFISARPGDVTDTPTRALLIERTWFAYYDPKAPKPSASSATPSATPSGTLTAAPSAPSSAAPAQVARGLVVLMPGVYGTPHDVIERLIVELRASGWGVLRMLAHPSRFTERLELRIAGASLEADVRAAAKELGERTGECAYAAQAATLLVMEKRPELWAKPRVLVGLSAGAVVLPTVMAFDPKLYDGAVLIAGGVDLLRITGDSAYADFINALRVRYVAGAGQTSERVRAAASALYPSVAPIDTQHTASVLRDKRVLIVHASGDRAVPADSGDRLWELAGRPERWTFGLGHELLFFTLSGRAPEIVAWMNEHMAAVPDAKPPAREER
jgi:hypothetical protein